MKKIFSALSLFAIFTLISQCVNSAEVKEKLERIITSPLKTGDLVPFKQTREIILTREGKACAVLVNSDSDSKLATKAAEKLRLSYGVEFPVIDAQEAKKFSGTLILIGKVNANRLLRELNANGLLENNLKGYEVRTLPNVLDWRQDVLYFGGKSETEVMRGIDMFLQKRKDPEHVSFLINCEGCDTIPERKELDAMISEIRAHYAEFDSKKNHRAVQFLLIKPANLYRKTGRDEYAKTFAEMQKIMIRNFDRSALGDGENPPTFVFHTFPQFVYLVENSPAYTATDHLEAAELMRKVTERTMDFWEMSIPRELYAEGRREYLTNHYCFASRTAASVARFLISRYDYRPARYWQAVADNALDGVAPHPFSPEDAAGYQFLCYRIFLDYALASGRYDTDFFRSRSFLNYIHYTKSLFNHLGYTPGFGDAYPNSMCGGYPILKQAVDILNDHEAEWLLQLTKNNGSFFVDVVDQYNIGAGTPPGVDTYGLTVIPVVPFKQKRYSVDGLYKRPTLDKAIFRSGWEKGADFLALTGINGAPHGHYDANGISQYISGPHLWLFEGDYIRKYPYDHNSLVINRDGLAPAQSRNSKERQLARLSQITGTTNATDRKTSAMSLLLENYNGADWTRTVGYMARGGFWVIDSVTARTPGDYSSECVWRVAGQPSIQPQGALYTQKESGQPHVPNNFSISEGTGAVRVLKTVFEYGHGRRNGYISNLPYAGKNTNFMLQRRARKLDKDESLTFVNYLKAVGGKNPEPIKLQRLSDSAWLALDPEGYRLAVMGKFSHDELAIDADFCFVSSRGINAIGARRLAFGDSVWKSIKRIDVSFSEKDFFGTITKESLTALLENLSAKQYAGQKENMSFPAAASPAELAIQQRTSAIAAEFKNNISSVASLSDSFCIGTYGGEVAAYDKDGKQKFSTDFKSAVRSLCGLNTESGLCWAAGFAPERGDDAPLRLLGPDGALRWEKTIKSYHKRAGTVRALFTAALDAKERSLIAGSEGHHYYAFSSSGKELWRSPITHGATAGAAGDMDGDGRDEIVTGGEYYYHTLADDDGKVLLKRTTSPWDEYALVADLNGDGLAEGVCGRGDSKVYIMAPESNPIKNWSANVGGKPVGLLELPNKNGAVLACATAMGDVVFISPEGERLGLSRLNTPLSDIIFFNGKILVACLDGYVYMLNTNGKAVCKWNYDYDWTSLTLPKLVCDGTSGYVSSGKKLFRLN